MSLQNRVEKLEGRRGEAGGVKFVVNVPPKMTREEWAEHAREMTARGGFTVNLEGAARDEQQEASGGGDVWH